MATFERGFKSWAERTSLAVRRELGLAADAPLPPEDLAAHLDVTLWTPSDVSGLTEEIADQLSSADPWGWSAVSFTVDGHGTIIYNPRKSKGRRASDIAHELAHFILDHQPATIIVSADLEFAMRSFDAKQEDEANWLAWCLLLPREALVWASLRKLSVAQIAEHYGVSETLVNMRINRTGVLAQLKAVSRYRRMTGKAR
jgi:Zn-dependent peptidase ImmA (M78 family)